MTTGVMQEIRERLSAGQSSGDVISQGYAPATVYKVQRRLRQAESDRSLAPAVPATQGEAESAACVEELEGEIRGPDDPRASPQQEASEREDTRLELAEAEAAVAELEFERDDALRQVDSLASSLSEANEKMESEAFEARLLRHAVNDLRRQLNKLADSEAEAQKAVSRIQGLLEAEQLARQEAEQKWYAWSAAARRIEIERDALRETVAELEPLRVWAGHPCKVCRKPMAGVVVRQSAAKVMEEFGHKDCLKQNSGSPLALVAAIAGAYGLSKLR